MILDMRISISKMGGGGIPAVAVPWGYELNSEW